jgi:uncharacterized damage-inducible protein DinB
MKTKELLLKQMKACFTQKNWFVSLLESLEELSPENASKKVAGFEHSIMQIVLHILFWNERYLKEFQGIKVDKTDIPNDITFNEDGMSNKFNTWEEIRNKLDQVIKDWVNALSVIEEDKINKETSEYNWSSIISNINAHTAYHTGQIIVLRKQQGSWNNRLGVN